MSFWPGSVERLRLSDLSKQSLGHFADVNERLEPCPGQDTWIGRSFFSPKLLPFEWREIRFPRSGSGIPGEAPYQ